MKEQSNYIDKNDIIELLTYVLTKEKEIYEENPMPTKEVVNLNRQSYRKKVEEISGKIAKREGMNIED